MSAVGSVVFGAVSHLTAGRGQMGTSLSFHLFFAVLGVGLPLMNVDRRGDASAFRGSVAGLARRRYQLARGATMLTAGAIVWGWLIAQSPRLIGPRL
jgi:cytochrome d ubiquinol oxidase subunit I